MSKTVIVGGSHAAIAAAAKLRQLDADMNITIISDENTLPYQRPPLSKNYMAGNLPLERLYLRPKDWFTAENIDLQLGAVAVKINTQNQQLEVSNGKLYDYDKLLIATGASARKLPMATGGSLSNIRVMRNLGDANWLMTKMQQGKNLVVIGGGYIGLEAASEASKKGLNVTLIEAAKRILERVACPQTSDAIRTLHQENGVKIIENTQMKCFVEKNGQAIAVRLANGTEIPLDIAIVGIGVTPNIQLAKTANIEISNGIAVDEYCRTSQKNIYAIGDCACLPFDNLPTRLESVQNAHDQAAIAAQNICGTPTIYAPKPWFWSDQFNVKLQIAGLNRGYDSVIVKQGKREASVSHYYFRQEKLIAVDSLNDPATYAMVRKALEANIIILQDQVKQDDFNIRDTVKALTSG